jgi:hypothetical protein
MAVLTGLGSGFMFLAALSSLSFPRSAVVGTGFVGLGEVGYSPYREGQETLDYAEVLGPPGSLRRLHP